MVANQNLSRAVVVAPWLVNVLRGWCPGWVKRPFRYDNPTLNFLYLNGVIDVEEAPDRPYVKFPCPFVQKRLFNYFADELFGDLSYPYTALDALDDVITEESLNVASLLRRYEDYLQANRDWLLKDAPRRADLSVYEAVYYFNLYMYLFRVLQQHGGQVWPEFPAGNGRADLIIHYAGRQYAVEVKSFTFTFYVLRFTCAPTSATR